MDDRKVLSIGEFRKIRAIIDNSFKEWEKIEEAIDENQDLSDEEQRAARDQAAYDFIEKIYVPQTKMLSSYDLSGIPAEEWYGFILFSEERYPLDFSATKANIDFSIINNMGLENYNFKGCNIKNIDSLSIYELEIDGFDEEFIKNNAETFLDDTYPYEFRNKFLKQRLSLKDYAELPEELRNKLANISIRSFEYSEKPLVEYLGIPKYIDFYNKFSSLENFDYIHELLQVFYDWRNKVFEKAEFEEKIEPLFLEEMENITAENLEKTLKKYVELSFDYYWNINPSIYSQKFIDENPKIFLNIPGVSKELKQKYYRRTLNIDDIFDNIEIFKDKLSKRLLESSYEGNWQTRFIKSFQNEIPELCATKLDFLKRISKDSDFLYKLIDGEKEPFDKKMESAYKEYGNKNYIAYDYYIQYIKGPIEENYDNLSLYEILTQKRASRSEKENELLDRIINNFGLEYILKLEEETGIFTSGISKNKGLYPLELFGLIAENTFSYRLDKLGNPNSTWLSYSKFEEIFTEVLVSIQNTTTELDFDYQNIKGEYRNRHSELFISKDELVGLTNLEQEEIINRFYSGTLKFDDIKKYPILSTILENKNISFIFRGYIPKESYEPNFLKLYKRIGQEKFLNIALMYGDNIQKALNGDFSKLNENSSIEDICNTINLCIYDNILNGVKYNTSLPEIFKKQYSFLFLPEEVPNELKEKFYNKKLTIKDFEENPDLLKYFTNTDLACGFEQLEKLISLKSSTKDETLDNIKKLKVAKEYETMSEFGQTVKNIYIDYINKHWDTMKVDSESFKYLKSIITRICYSNSGKLYRIRNEIIPQILDSANPTETLNEIEHLYLTNNLPDVAKTFEVFRILHREENGNLYINTGYRSSPVLLKHSNNVNEFIMWSDLLKSAIESNNRSIQEYLVNIKKGDELFRAISSGDKSFSRLTEKEEKTLKTYSKMLNVLYNQTYAGKHDRQHILSGDIEKDIQECISLFTQDGKIESDIPDRLVKMFAYFAGVETYDQLDKYIKYNTMLANKRNKERATKPFVLEEGDIIKGLRNEMYLPNTLQNGANASEFLGDDASDRGDATPLDTDFSRIQEVYPTLEETMVNTIAGGCGPIWIVIKHDNEKLYYTRYSDATPPQEIKFIPNKLEVFSTCGGDHYGIRTGFGSTNIDYIIVDYPDTDIEVDIALNGFYIPIVDKTTGEIIYTYDDYEKIRKQMAGLSHYGCEEYEFSHELIIPEIEELKYKLKENENIVQQKLSVIEKTFIECVKNIECSDPKDNYSLTVKTKIDGDIQPGVLEIIDIGSTGRNTGDPSDADFDYAIRVDNEIINNSDKLASLKKSLAKGIGQEVGQVFHYDDVKIEGIEEAVKIEADFYPKRDTITYTTDMAIKDRLDTLKELDQEKYEYVLANIVYAKKVLKEAECYYKGGHSKCKKAGLGGVGVENWILQNGGSFVEASRTFLDAATDDKGGFIPFTEFNKKYRIWSFGENYRQKETDYYRHEEFIRHNMHEDGYQAMCKTLSKFIEKVDGRKEIETMFSKQPVTQVSSAQK